MEEFSDLNVRQREAVFSNEKKICVVAGPGCGKTRTLIMRVVHLLRNEKVRPQTILLLTFSKKAIREIKARISKQLGVAYSFRLNIHNFHSFCYELLRENFRLFGLQADFLVYDRSDQEALLKKIIRERSQTLSNHDFNNLVNDISLSKIRKNYIEELKNNNYENFLVYEDYEKLLHREEVLDFNDLLLRVLGALRDDRIARKVNSEFTNILVDEFQDVNEIQWEIVNLLATGNRAKVFLVGDPNQSIYGFQGSSPHLILSLIRDDDWRKIFLNINYRSTRNILKLSNLFLRENSHFLISNQLETENSLGIPVEIITNCSPRFIVKKILYLIEVENVRPSSIALIYRSNYLSSFIEQELISNGIFYEILGSFKFVEREEIKDILAYLKIVRFPVQSDPSILRILKGLAGVGNKLVRNIEIISKENNSSIFGYLNTQFSGTPRMKCNRLKLNKLQEKNLVKTIKSLNHLIEKLSQRNTLEKFVDNLIEELNYFEKLNQKINSRQRRKNVQQFLNLAKIWESEHHNRNKNLYNTLGEFLQYCSIAFDDSSFQKEGDNLILSSIHQIKGLEFDFVFFLYLDHNILPHRTSADLTEEKRLFYVGITRAKKSLYLISNSNNPSSFLEFLSRENS